MDKDIAIVMLIERLDIALAKIKSLEAELAVYKNPKNSGNSHKPPSSDIAPPKRNQSLREKTGKKSGGQPGHKGNTLQMNEHPDKVVEHKPCTCGNCGSDLSSVEKEMVEKRQVVDIPTVKPEWVEHRVYAKTCSCGYITGNYSGSNLS